jgi:hypothetical protein
MKLILLETYFMALDNLSQGSVQVGLNRVRSEDEYRELLSTTLEDCERLAK